MNLTLLTAWVLAHGVAALIILTAAGTFAGVIEKYTTGKVSNIAGAIAGVLIDVVKVAAQIYALLGGQPPSSPMGKKLMRGVFDDTTGSGPPIVLGKDPGSGKLPGMKRIAFAMAVVLGVAACTQLTPAAGPTADAVACASGYIVETGLEGVTPTVSGFETQCSKEIAGLTTAALTTIFDLLMQAFATPITDAGNVSVRPPSPFLAGATLLRNAYAAKAAAK